jgi:hypothetical protein
MIFLKKKKLKSIFLKNLSIPQGHHFEVAAGLVLSILSKHLP